MTNRLIDYLHQNGMLLREPTTEELEYFRDSPARSKMESQQILQWIRSTFEAAKQIAQGFGDDPALFWIRLGGLLMDIRERNDNELQQVDALKYQGPTREPFESLHRALSALLDEFSTGEKLYIEYRRHVECHPLQNAYRPQVNAKHATIRRTFKSKLLSRDVELDEFDREFSALFEEHDRNEYRIAVALATRALPHAESVEHAANLVYRTKP